MLLRRAGQGTLPPPGFTSPPWSALTTSWNAVPVPQTPTVTLGPEVVVLGHDDFEVNDESTDVNDYEFGWDNEHPKRKVKVDQFKIEWRPVDNGQFYEFYKGEGHGKVNFPESWVEIDGQVHVSLVSHLLVVVSFYLIFLRFELCMALYRWTLPICGRS
jgi:L-histidine Nalpha-methyltransferase / hercynylcysteine S-oxide synthase